MNEWSLQHLAPSTAAPAEQEEASAAPGEQQEESAASVGQEEASAAPAEQQEAPAVVDAEEQEAPAVVDAVEPEPEADGCDYLDTHNNGVGALLAALKRAGDISVFAPLGAAFERVLEESSSRCLMLWTGVASGAFQCSYALVLCSAVVYWCCPLSTGAVHCCYHCISMGVLFAVSMKN